MIPSAPRTDAIRRIAPSVALASSLGLHVATALAVASAPPAPAAVDREPVTVDVVAERAAEPLPEPPPPAPPSERRDPSPRAVTRSSPAPSPAPTTASPYDLAEPDPPTAAAASQVLTAPERAEVSPAATTFVSGTAPNLGFGFASATGEGSGAGKGLGRGGDHHSGDTTGSGGASTGARPAAADRSRPAGLLDGMASACDFPAAAVERGIDRAMVAVVVTIAADGHPLGVGVVSDPGFGFGAAARACALQQRYRAGLDKNGLPTLARTPPIRVRFIR